MAWQTELTTMLRYMIGDNTSGTYKYTDGELQTLLTVGARFVDQDIDSPNSYTISVETTGISPDPTSIPDDVFSNLTVLKAACITDEWSTRKHAIREGITAVCGPTKLGIDTGAEGLTLLITHGPCATYDRMKTEYAYGNTRNIKGIMSPFVSNQYQPVD